MSKFITLQNLQDDEDFENLFEFQELGLNKIDFDEIEILYVPDWYWINLIHIIERFKLTLTILEPSCNTRFKYDFGNLIEANYSNNYWEKTIYNSHGNRVRCENSNGLITQWFYDKKKRLIKFKNNIKIWKEYKYDSVGNLIRTNSSTGEWKKWEFNKSNKLLKFSNSSGEWFKNTYDKNNNKIRFENHIGDYDEWEYDDNSNLLKISCPNIKFNSPKILAFKEFISKRIIK